MRPSKALYCRARSISAEGRITVGNHPPPRIELTVAQHDILTRNVRLARPAAIVATDDAAIGCGILRPVDESTVERELLRRVVACRQFGDERGVLPGCRI